MTFIFSLFFSSRILIFFRSGLMPRLSFQRPRVKSQELEDYRPLERLRSRGFMSDEESAVVFKKSYDSSLMNGSIEDQQVVTNNNCF